MSKVAYITPTYLPDIDRFSLLRKSINVFSKNINHIALVDYKHYSQFSERFGRDDNLTLVSTKDVLPASLNSQLRLRDSVLWRGIERVAWRLWMNPGALRGWKIQQLAKIHALSELSEDVGVFLDSDIFLCQPTDHSFFLPEGNVMLFESAAISAEEVGLDIATYLLLKEKISSIKEYNNFIHVGATFKKVTAENLLKKANAANNGKFDFNFLQHELPSEYNLLGIVAKKYENYVGYSKYHKNPRDLLFDVRYDFNISDDICNKISSLKENSGNARFALIQSNLSIDPSVYSSSVLDFINSYHQAPQN